MIEIGVRYGPPATLNSAPGGVTMICAGVAPVTAAGGAAGTGALGSRGGVVGGTVPVGGVVPAGGNGVTGGGGGWMPGRVAAPAGGVGFGVCAPAGAATGGAR